MLPRLRTVRERLQDAAPKLLDTTISLSGLEARLCARYGYGLTVKCENASYFFHLPDVETDPRHAALLRDAVFPDEDSLLRLRRRTRPGMTILEACAGCGLRSVFYAGSMRAGRVYALGGEARDVSTSRKNVLLNDVDAVVQVHLLRHEHKAPGALDKFCRVRKIKNLDLISLDEPGLAFAGLEGAEDMLRRHGPAVIIWGQWGEEAARTQTFLDGLGYAGPEAWTPKILFWAPRI
jgi:tRNA A58 N-methylase Trm61